MKNSPSLETRVTFEPADETDAESLASLRVEAMKESLERIGRFDPQRARDRFLADFSPAHTRHILLNGTKIGFFVVKPQKHELLLDHLYIKPGYQNLGIGSAVLNEVFTQSAQERRSIRVGALRESDSNRFYLRHRFTLVEKTEFDNYYVRQIILG